MKTIKWELRVRDAGEKATLENGVIGFVEYEGDSPINDDGMLIDDINVHKHIAEVQSFLINEFISVTGIEVKDE